MTALIRAQLFKANDVVSSRDLQDLNILYVKTLPFCGPKMQGSFATQKLLTIFAAETITSFCCKKLLKAFAWQRILANDFVSTVRLNLISTNDFVKLTML